jgi:hypothetical protein
MPKQINPLLKRENREELGKRAMKSIIRRQSDIISRADRAIGDVRSFEQSVHKAFISRSTPRT